MWKYKIVFCLVFLNVKADKFENSKDASGQHVGENYYLYDTSKQVDRMEALEHCKRGGGELTKLTGKSLYNVLRRLVLEEGSYWIDGIDKNDKDRFVHTGTCTSDELNFDGIPAAKLAFTPRTCLALFKGAQPETSGIEAISCFSRQIGVICSLPNGSACTNSTPSSLKTTALQDHKILNQ